MELDLGDPRVLLRDDVLDDPRPFHDRLRAEAPIWQIPGQDTYVVSDPALVREVVGRPGDFSSNLVSLLHDDGTGRPIPFPMAPYRDPIHVLSTADPPLHTRHRKLLLPFLNPAAVAQLETDVRDIVDELLQPLLDQRSGDAVAEFTDRVPARTICRVIGLAPEETARVTAFASGTSPLLDGITDADGMQRAMTSAMELGMYVYERVADALANPATRFGILSVFGDAIEAGDITVGDVCNILVVFVTAGSETTASLLATAVETLARDQELQERLRRDPDAVPHAIEEFLRADGPFQFHYRYTPAAAELGGMTIPAESRVMLMWAAANRPAPDGVADAADDDSDIVSHFAFGRGLHFCIGAPLARLEARVAITRLLERTTSITLDPEQPPTRRPSIFIRRHASLPVVVEPR